MYTVIITKLDNKVYKFTYDSKQEAYEKINTFIENIVDACRKHGTEIEEITEGSITQIYTANKRFVASAEFVEEKVDNDYIFIVDEAETYEGSKINIYHEIYKTLRNAKKQFLALVTEVKENDKFYENGELKEDCYEIDRPEYFEIGYKDNTDSYIITLTDEEIME